MEESIVFPLFKRAIRQMLEDGEFHKEFRHKRRVRRIADTLAEIEDNCNGGIEGMPIAPLIMIINDAEVWQDALLYMEGIAHQSDDAND